ncbi:MAG TPA: HD domain-containing phosphohydrolase [Actinomycetota bacterium]|nr:HD domain-containing phosphohydrolase [Actinomycetota bacterium]
MNDTEVQQALENAAWATRVLDEAIAFQTAPDFAGLFAAFAKSVIDLLEADACLVSLFDPGRRTLRDVAASVAPGATLNRMAEEYSVDDYPATARAIDNNRGFKVSVSDPEADHAERSLASSLGFTCLLLHPLRARNETIGTVEVYRSGHDDFDELDVNKLSAIASLSENAYVRILLTNEVEDQYTAMLGALTAALEARDVLTLEHTSRIQDSAIAVASLARLSQSQVIAVKFGAILHDIGKIGVPDAILLKPGPLTPEERLEMQRHPEIGVKMVEGIPFARPALAAIRHHHERWDGTGYPDGLREDEIPIEARIVSVCDAFDAMISNRPYRDAMSVVEAAEQLRANAGTQFDPLCVRLFLEILEAGGPDHMQERVIRYGF